MSPLYEDYIKKTAGVNKFKKNKTVHPEKPVQKNSGKSCAGGGLL